MPFGVSTPIIKGIYPILAVGNTPVILPVYLDIHLTVARSTLYAQKKIPLTARFDSSQRPSL